MINTLTLTDFRNHASCRINTSGKQNIFITGPNGAGKTAILEAVSLLGGDRGMRGVQMSDIARMDGDGGFCVFANLDDDTQVAIQFNNNENTRRAKIDQDSATLTDLSKLLRIVWITPREDRLFVDNSADRRIFFDRLVACFDATHTGRNARLSKLASERAYALKSGADSKWIDALDTQIAGVAITIAAARIQYAGELNFFLKNCAVSVQGTIEKMLIDGVSAGDAERQFLEYLKNNRTLIADKMVIDGPHKSDFGVFNKQLKLPAYLTSTGQQKNVLMELILAHAKLIKTKTGKSPIILLDEAAAHLDENARNKLFQELGDADAQVWATGLDASIFKNVKNAAFVACQNGEINNIVMAE